jgi:hypothetical protein
MENLQIKSRKRVSAHGEVFTNKREVNAMLDLVKQETERIESRFLEPACGTGNFLIEILARKLKIVNDRYYQNRDEWEFYSILAISSIYGIDLLEDNCKECRVRLYNHWEKLNRERFFWETENIETNKTVGYILSRNILCGDALTMVSINNKPIIFSEWSALNSCLIKRRDFRLDELLEGKTDKLQIRLFENKSEWEYDPITDTYIPKPIEEFKPIHFRKIYEQMKWSENDETGDKGDLND